MGTRYTLRRPPAGASISQDRVCQIAKEIGTYPVLVYALLNRGFTEPQIRDIIQNEFAGDELMKTPLKGAAEAAERLLNAMNQNQRIGIFADYDCDGITSGFVMQQGLASIKHAMKSQSSISLHYPQRKDGYGLSDAYCKAAAGKLDLVVTVDNGIAARKQESILASLGISLIVTDHHEPNRMTLPVQKGTVIVDPCYSDISRSYLAGVAVAYNVVLTAAHKIGITLNRGIFLPAVMLGTISDCMPMSYENACYIKAGLSFLNENDKYSAFFHEMFYDSYNKKVKEPPVITAKDISFTVAPKINSASRMGDTRIGAMGLFLGFQEQKKLEKIAKELTKLNDARKVETAEIASDVVDKIALGESDRIVIYDGSDYSKGLLGIIASKITNRFPDYPAFVYEKQKDGVVSGSVRCDNEGIDCMEMFKQLKSEGIVKFCAGHSRACALAVEESKLQKFLDGFSALYDSLDIPEVVKTVDATTSLKALSNDFLEKVNQIPFTTQEKPLFLVPNVFINHTKLMGKNKQHIELSLADSTAVKKINWWNMAQHYEDLGSPKEAHLVCSIEQDFRMSKPYATLDIIDMIPVKEVGTDAA